MASRDCLALALAIAVLPVTVGILVYVLASFVLMRPHVERRPRWSHLREALREAAWAAVTQPLLPLFYVLGRRMAAGKGTPVVAVHGYTQNRVDFLRIARACGKAGVGPVYGFNYAWFSTVPEAARRLAGFVEDVLRETGEQRVDLVAHSLGGLVSLEYVHGAGADHVRRLVTIASPHAGIAWRGPIVGRCGPQMRAGSAFLVDRADRAVPASCLSIYSSHDNVVHPPATSALARRGGRDHRVSDVGHLSILFDPRVAEAVVDFLARA
jgi:triacylglycerol lipase